MNKAIILGNLGRDPEVSYTGAGNLIVKFSIATSDFRPDPNSSENKEHTEWHRIVIFNERLGKVAQQYLKKGSKVYVEGQVRTREYTDRNGNQDVITEVVLNQRGDLQLLDKAPPREQRPERRPSAGSPRDPDFPDDDVPF